MNMYNCTFRFASMKKTGQEVRKEMLNHIVFAFFTVETFKNTQKRYISCILFEHYKHFYSKFGD